MNSVSRLITSQTFKVSIATSLVVSLIAAVFVAGIAWLDIQRAEQDEIETLQHEVEELIEFIEEDGLDAVIIDRSDEYGPLWPDEEADVLTADNSVLLRVAHKGKAVLGFEALDAPLGWAWLEYPFERHETDEKPRLRTLSVNMENDITVVGALPHGAEYQTALAFLRKGVLGLLFVVLPLALLTAILISQYVFRRLEKVSTSIDAITAGELAARVPTSIKNDEFDQLAKKVNAMMHQIRSLMKNVENVSVGIAHDLKTPLTRLDQRLQYIEHDKHNPVAVQKHLDIAHTNIQSLLGVFGALLRLAEIDSGKRKDNFSPLSLSELVDDVADTYATVFSEKGRKLDISIVPNLDTIGDKNLIAQLISNLLENALQHANDEGRAWLRLQLHNDGIVLQIGDDGPGIPDNERERIFERFYRLDKGRNTPGNGLGLSLVSSICALHDAKIHLYPNQPGLVIDIVFPPPR
ncbi:MAG: HAMP domain-containing sensor histidine kinase [Pseudomonadota bacterium]